MRVAFHVEWKTVWVAASGQCSAACMQGSVSSWLFSPATKMCLREGHRRADSHESVLTGSCEERRLFLEKLLHGMTKVVLPPLDGKWDGAAANLKGGDFTWLRP